jgi:hypothetical protein
VAYAGEFTLRKLLRMPTRLRRISRSAFARQPF